MPKAPTPAQAYARYESKVHREKVAQKRAISGKTAAKVADGRAEREYQAELEAKGQMTIF